MCTGKRQTHIRNAPSSRTAVSGIGLYTDGIFFVPHCKNRTFDKLKNRRACQKTTKRSWETEQQGKSEGGKEPPSRSINQFFEL